MDDVISTYRELFNLQNAHFSYIDHEDAMVATVFKITLESREPLILKICSRTGDYMREAYFLHHFSEKLPVPHIIQLATPNAVLHGAILMECLPGKLLKIEDLNNELSHDIGLLLARIHSEFSRDYGDLTDPEHLYSDPRIPFTMKFEEGIEECKEHLPGSLLKKCHEYYERHVDLLSATDGPCIIHRDFRPGNIIIDKGKIQGIIDWSSARGGFAEEDFCPFEFGDWTGIAPSSKDSFLAGYANIRKVPQYHHILPLLRLSRAIATVGFTIKRKTWKSKGAKIYQFNRQYLESFLNDV